jgi:hypothetical protein
LHLVAVDFSQKKEASAQTLIFIVSLRLVYGLQIWCGIMGWSR